jgi:hypothetical protein
VPDDPFVRVGAGLVLGICCTALVDEAVAGLPLGWLAWVAVAAPLAIHGSRGRRTGGAAPRPIDACCAVAVALLVCAPWYWSLPVGIALVAAVVIYRRLVTRSHAAAVASAMTVAAAGLAVGRLVRPTYWWLPQQEQLYFDVLASSISTVGTGDSTFARGFVIHYHWLSFAWAGLWSRVADLGPQVMVARVGPLVVVTATVLVMSGVLRRTAPSSRTWPALVLAALVGSTLVGDGGFTWLLADLNHGLAAALVAVAWWLVITGPIDHRRALLLGVVAFAALGANGMYGLTLTAAIACGVVGRSRRAVLPVGVASVLALWYFFGFPLEDSPGRAGIFGRPPFDFVRAISREIEIFHGVNFAIVAAAHLIGAAGLGGVGAWYAWRVGRRAPGLGGFVGGGVIAGGVLLVFGHTDTYADQVLCWAAALGPAITTASLGAVDGLARLDRRMVRSAIVAGLLGAAVVVAHHAWSLRLVGSGSSTAIKVRSLRGFDLVPAITLVMGTSAWRHLRLRGRSEVVRPMALALSVVAIASFGVLQFESYRVVRPALDVRAASWLGGDRVDPVVHAIDERVARTEIVAVDAPDDLGVVEVVSRTRRRYLVTMPPTASVRELDAPPWSAWVQASMDVRSPDDDSRRAALSTLRELGVSWLLLDARTERDVPLDASIRVAYRDERWILGALEVSGRG